MRGKKTGKKLRGVDMRDKPQYSIEEWNLSGCAEENLATTNNIIEGVHNR